jgi:uncharacterized protein (UPF0332 family)
MSKKDYIQIATELVEQAGGTVVGRVVEKVGVSLLYDYGLTSEGESIIQYFAQKRGDDFGAGQMTDYSRLVDFAARITYLSYYQTSAMVLQQRLQEKGHLGVYEMREVAVLVAGCSLECVLELVSNRLNRSCRLTSSKTNAAIETLYANTVDAVWVEQFLKLRKSYLESTHKTLEEKNQFNLSAKCGYVVISMGMRDWYFLLKSRLVDKGLEQEVRTVLVQIEKQLKQSKNWVF